MKIFVMGALGKMGRLLIEKLEAESNLHVIGGGDTEGAKLGDIEISGDNSRIYELVAEAEIVLDFSSPTGTEIIIDACEKYKKKLVSGTTGLLPGQQGKIGQLSKIVSVVQAANFSVGITLLTEFTRKASSALTGAECEIVEKHHRKKADSPSGTALALGRAIANERKQDLNANLVFGRHGTDLTRKAEIGMHSLRGGTIVGDHEVHFILENEIITLGHRACSRDIFADGAILAIQFIAEKENGLFSMRDVIGLKM